MEITNKAHRVGRHALMDVEKDGKRQTKPCSSAITEAVIGQKQQWCQKLIIAVKAPIRPGQTYSICRGTQRCRDQEIKRNHVL